MTSLERRTIQALLDLLLDESPSVVEAAREKLAEMGEAGELALREAVAGDDARLRVRARAALDRVRRRATERAIAELAARSDADIDLEEGAFLLAKVEYPDRDRAAYSAILDSIGEQLRERVAEIADPHARAAELSRLMAGEWRLRGNEENFEDPDNSFIPRVLDRRKGIPISLAAVYLFVAKRAGLPLQGIGSPGHYLLRYGPAALDLYIDPMTGRRMTREEATRMLAAKGFPVTRSAFEPAGARDTLVRMCSNLVSVYQRRRARGSSDQWRRLRDALRREG